MVEQQARVAQIAGDELGGPDFRCFIVNTDMDLAPDTALCAAMLAGVLFTFVFDFISRAVEQQMQWAW